MEMRNMSEAISNTDTELLTPKQAAAYLQTPVSTLADWRLKGTGPKFARCGGRHVRYRKAWLDEWLDAHAVSSTAEAKRIAQL
jgi:excisionase family DNA binding protein